jgi:hypothetical protein
MNREPTPEMIAAAWKLLDEKKLAGGIARLGPGIGARELWETMWDAAPKGEGGK